MPQVKGDIFIGQRMREEVDRLFPSLTVAAKAFRCDRKNFTGWMNGLTPSSIQLAKLHYLGGDVLYVLTGKRSGLDGKSLRDLPPVAGVQRRRRELPAAEEGGRIGMEVGRDV